MKEAVFTFTIDDIVKFILALAGGVTAISVAIGWVCTWIKRAKAPSDKIHATLKEHEDRMDEIEERIEQIESNRSEDKQAIDELTQGNKIVQKSLLAIMEQFLSNGTDKKSLEDAKQELQQYLIDK